MLKIIHHFYFGSQNYLTLMHMFHIAIFRFLLSAQLHFIFHFLVKINILLLLILTFLLLLISFSLLFCRVCHLFLIQIFSLIHYKLDMSLFDSNINYFPSVLLMFFRWIVTFYHKYWGIIYGNEDMIFINVLWIIHISFKTD